MIRLKDSSQGFVSRIRLKDSSQGFVSRIRLKDSSQGFVSRIRLPKRHTVLRARPLKRALMKGRGALPRRCGRERPSGPHDMQIGGHTRSEGLSIVANNMRVFARRAENWI